MNIYELGFYLIGKGLNSSNVSNNVLKSIFSFLKRKLIRQKQLKDDESAQDQKVIPFDTGNTIKK